jgi:hypothetical protein
MSVTTGRIVPTPGAATPFKVVFRSQSEVICEYAVVSRRSGDELIAALLPSLQDFEQL